MCHEEDGQYVVDRDINVEGVYSSTVFNAGLAPVYMVEANRRYLASFTDKLSFASSDGNSEIALDGHISCGQVKFFPEKIKAGYIRDCLPHIQAQPDHGKIETSCIRGHVTISKAKLSILYTSIPYNFK